MSKRLSAIPEPKAKPSFLPTRSPLLQRKCACGNSTDLAGQCNECQKNSLTIQRQSSDESNVAEVPPIVHEVLHSQGHPLDKVTRDFMESRIGHDFSQVRIHTDDRAAKSAKSVNALAYTVGRDVVFGATQYAPNTNSGKSLIAHELAHTIQQQHSHSLNIQKQSATINLDDKLEREADQIATAAAPKPTKQPTKKPKTPSNPCTRNILAEGSCKFLVLNAAGRCCDPDNGIENLKRSKD